MAKRMLLFSVLVFVTILVFTNMSEAAFVVTPMEFHLGTGGDGEVTETFYVRNRGDETIALKVYTGDFWIEPSGNELFLEPGKVERSCAKWIEVAPEEMELLPDAVQAVRVRMKVPPDALGSYWGMVFVEQTTKPTIKTAKRGEQQFNILSFQRVGVRIFENTPDAKIGEGVINSVIVKEGTDNSLFEIALTFKNEGAVILKCKPTIEIKNMAGETVKKIELDEINCYPGSERIAKGVIDEELAPGQYTALAIMDYGAEYLIAGEAIFEVTGAKRRKNITDVSIDKKDTDREENKIEDSGEFIEIEMALGNNNSGIKNASAVEHKSLLEKVKEFFKTVIGPKQKGLVQTIAEPAEKKQVSFWDRVKDKLNSLFSGKR